MPVDRDVIVIGAGHNGLVAAALLAKAGLKPLVLERADRVGLDTYGIGEHHRHEFMDSAPAVLWEVMPRG